LYISFARSDFMENEPHIAPPDQPPLERGRLNFARLGSALAVVLAVVALYFWIFSSPTPTARKPDRFLSFTAEEMAYAQKIQIEGVSLSRAENFLHQEVTTISGRCLNRGDRALDFLRLTIEFSDELNQVVLRETRPVLSLSAPHLAPAQSREFEISFDHLPSSWNRQPPSLRVEGLHFAPKLK